jgi:hypothetical protein
MEFQFTINGGLSQSADDLASGEIEAEVQVGSVSQRAFYGVISEGSAGVLGPGGVAIPGCVTGTDSFQCTNAVFSTTMLPVSLGTEMDFDIGLLVSTELLNGPSSVDPSTELSLTGIELFDADGDPVSDFSITSGSGADYGVGGLLSEPAAVPEPGTFWLLAIGFSVVAAGACARDSRSSRDSAN